MVRRIVLATVVTALGLSGQSFSVKEPPAARSAAFSPRAAQIVWYMMLRDKGVCSDITPPTPVTTFTPTDAQAMLMFSINGVKAGDVFASEYYTPSGDLYAPTSGPFRPASADGDFCFTDAPLKIAGDRPASLPGVWTVKVRLNGVLVFTLTFTIQAAAPTPSPATIVWYMMLRQTGAACSDVNRPTPVTTFAATDAQAVLMFSVDGVKAGDVFASEYYTPSGDLYAPNSGPFRPASADGDFCFTDSPLKIAGDRPASLPGAWTVRVRLNGVLKFTLTFTIQAAAPCSFTVAPTTQSAPAAGGSYTVGVTARTDCTWTASSGAAWITIQSGSPGTGNGTVRYTAAQNTASTSRTGTLTVAGQTVTVTQEAAAAACTYGIYPGTVTVAGIEVSDSVRVDATAGCAWTARSNAAWLTITAGATGTGNGTVRYTAAANPGLDERSGTLTVAGKTFTVRQAAGGGASQAVVDTIMGADWVFPAGVANPLDAPLGTIYGVLADSRGNVYFSDWDNSMVFRLGVRGELVLVAGNGNSGYAGDGGSATAASLNHPWGLALDGAGNLYIADFGNNRVRKVAPNGIISTLAGNGGSETSGDDGPAVRAAVGSPRSVAVDGDGSVYVVTNNVLRKVSADGVIRTLAGSSDRKEHSGDGGPAADAGFAGLQAVAVDLYGRIYLSDWDANRIRRISRDGVIETVVGTGARGYAGDGGPPLSAQLKNPVGLALDGAGNLYIADVNNLRIRKVSTDGNISTVAGNGFDGFDGDGGSALDASLRFAYGVAPDPFGNLWIADRSNFRVRKVDPSGVIQTAAGNGRFRWVENGTASAEAVLYEPFGFTRDSIGNTYLADSSRHTVWKISPDGAISRFAGSGVSACCGDDGPAVTALLASPNGVAADAQGNVYIADYQNHLIRKVDSGGTITTVAGIRQSAGYSGDDGPAIKAQLNYPNHVLLDPAGNLYVSDSANHRVRRITPDGIISTIAGTGEGGYSGDDGPATAAKFNAPRGLALDSAGNLYVADKWNHRVRRVTPDGWVTTVAGNGIFGYDGDGGRATAARLWNPEAVSLDGAGNLYIADWSNGRIRRVSPDGVITTVAGNGRLVFAGDGGPALAASFPSPRDILADGENLYVLDDVSSRLRVVRPQTISFDLSTASLAFDLTGGSGRSAPQAVSAVSASAGLPFTASASTGSGGAWLSVTPAAGFLPAALQVTVNADNMAPGTYQGSVRVTVAAVVRTLSVQFRVRDPNPPKLDADPAQISLTVPEGSQGEQALWVLNRGGGQLSFTADVSGVPGLTLPDKNGSASSASPGVISLAADARGLKAGEYSGAVVVAGSNGERRSVPVTLSVTAASRARLLVSHKSIAFTATRDGGDLPDDVAIANIGRGVMNWTVRAESDGNWLRLARESGSTDAAAAAVPLVRVEVRPAALEAGRDYTGRIVVSAPDADDGSRVIDVRLTVVRDGNALAPVARPTGLIYRTLAPGVPPGAQSVLLFNPTPRRTNFDAGVVPAEAVSWFSPSPARGYVAEAGSPDLAARLPTIQVQPTMLPPAGSLQEATLTVKFDRGVNRNINLYLFQPGASDGRSAAACNDARLYPVFTTLEPEFQAQPGRPISIVMSVVDGCGAPVTSGSVVASFTNGDSSLPLVSLKDGRWVASWTPRNTAESRVGIVVRAWQSGARLTGEAVISGTILR